MSWNFQHRKNLPLAALCGVVLVGLVMAIKPAMSHKDYQSEARLAEYVTLQSHIMRPAITGYGRVTPNISLNSLAEVSGRIVYRHPNLKKGELFAAGTELLRIDDSDYQLQLAKAQSALASAELREAAKHTAIKNTLQDIKLSEHKLAIANAEESRLKTLFTQRSASETELNKAKQAVLVQQQELQRLLNQQSLFPLELKVLDAELKQAQADVDKAQLELSRTVIRLPFTGRIHQVSAEEQQLVTKGMPLFSASGIEKVLINAQFDYAQFQQFVRFFNQAPDFAEIGSNGMQTYLAEQGLNAQVRLLGEQGQVWQAQLERFSDELDPQSQTVGVVVSISESYQQMQLGKKPPLLAGMRAQVELLAKAQRFVAIPRHLVNNEQILLADGNSTLRPTPLQSTLKQNNLVLSQDATLVGAKVLTNDLFPVIVGESLQLQSDERSQRQLENWLAAAALPAEAKP
ncbi:efflux RND transporter periplasmic adaptor subunit [Pseudoalteromonas fenneropenaei]|uniref:Efflux RND transporter periplasmic adaptor subunit n=1 Tax=Pseudoalteromonas fenneropenaei TaxID=1737459 RepID=A0ABV7CJV1_9GAMM